jgi:hypothetical protein
MERGWNIGLGVEAELFAEAGDEGVGFTAVEQEGLGWDGLEGGDGGEFRGDVGVGDRGPELEDGGGGVDEALEDDAVMGELEVEGAVEGAHGAGGPDIPGVAGVAGDMAGMDRRGGFEVAHEGSAAAVVFAADGMEPAGFDGDGVGFDEEEIGLVVEGPMGGEGE